MTCTARVPAAFGELSMLAGPAELSVIALAAAVVAAGAYYVMRTSGWRLAARIWTIFLGGVFVLLWGYLEASCPTGTLGDMPADAGGNQNAFLALAIPRVMAALAFIAVITCAAMIAAHKLAARRA